MTTAGMRRGGIVLTVLGLAGLIALYWMCFFWVSTEVNQGVVRHLYRGPCRHRPLGWTVATSDQCGRCGPSTQTGMM